MMNDRKMGDKVNRHYARTARRLMGYVASTYKLQLNKIAARWPAKAVA